MQAATAVLHSSSAASPHFWLIPSSGWPSKISKAPCVGINFFASCIRLVQTPGGMTHKPAHLVQVPKEYTLVLGLF